MERRDTVTPVPYESDTSLCSIAAGRLAQLSSPEFSDSAQDESDDEEQIVDDKEAPGMTNLTSTDLENLDETCHGYPNAPRNTHSAPRLPPRVRKNLGALVEYMREHQDDLAVQLQCCLFLTQYAAYQESSKIKAAKAGAIPAVLNVLKSVQGKNADDAKLNETAIWCLCTLCKCLENAKLAVQVGGIKPVIVAMTEYMDFPGVQEQGFYFFRTIAAWSKSLRKKIIDSGAEKVVRNSMRVHSENIDTVNWAEDCLSVISSEQPQHWSPQQSYVQGERQKTSTWNRVFSFGRR